MLAVLKTNLFELTNNVNFLDFFWNIKIKRFCTNVLSMNKVISKFNLSVLFVGYDFGKYINICIA